MMDLPVATNVSVERVGASSQTGTASTQDQAAGWIEEDTDVADRAEQEVNVESTAPKTKSVREDNLQTLDGIGPGIQSRLYEYGILTFADLAKLDEDAAIKLGTHLELEEPNLVIEWSAQAQELIS